MASSEQEKLSAKIDFELGKVSKQDICKKHRISRPTLRKWAKVGKWIYQRSFKEVSKEVEKRVIEKLVEENTDVVSKVTERFLKDSSNVRGVTISIVEVMAKELIKTKGCLAASEANRILTCQKANQSAGKTLTDLYNSERRALGMDADDQGGLNIIIKIDSDDDDL